MFEMKSASFAVNDRMLLHPTSLRFEQGRVYGLIGHNGSGKSTLIKLLARQQPHSGGEILFDDQPLSAWGNREFARQVAYLPQHLPSAENLLGRELVEMGRYPWRGLLGRMGAEDHRQVERAIALTHTERFADRMVDTLSGGERGRVWLAMLLAQESRFSRWPPWTWPIRWRCSRSSSSSAASSTSGSSSSFTTSTWPPVSAIGWWRCTPAVC